LDLREIVVWPIGSGDEPRYQELLRQHHYLGALPKISETLWYVATRRQEWLALLSFSASALKCGVRDRWIGWNFRQRYSRLKLVVNNSRFLILPDGQRANLGSNELYAREDASLAIDGKTLCNPLDPDGHPTHVMSVVGHESKNCYTQKKWAPCP
jgi:hypothetical protein